MQLFQNIFVSIALLTQIVFAIEITENKVDRGTVTLNLGDITIYPGASWSIIDNAYTNFVGKLDVRDGAGLYISLTSHLLALQVSLTTLLHSITNNGVVSFDSRISRTSSSYDSRGVSFTNNGEMYFAASGEFSSSTALTSALWTNTGLLLFYQNQRTSGTVSLGMPLGSITNTGQVCLNNQVYEQTTQIKGSGCFTANGDSTIYISNVLLAVSPKQNFYLTDKGSSMIVQAVSTTQTFNVYGFGEGNKIGLTIPLMGNLWNSAYAYDTTSGILTLRNLLLEQKFNIGTGYDPSKFQVVTDSGSGIPSTILGSVAYYGRVPERTLPKSCQIPCKPIPEAPGTTPTQYTTTITKTNTAGNTVTESGVVNVLTDKGGSWFTTTSMFPALSTAPSTATVFSSDTIMSTVEPNTTELASPTDIPVETSSAEELSSVMSNWETSSAPTLSIETPVSSHQSSTQHSSFESSADINTVFSSKSAFETASDYIVSTPSLVSHSTMVPQSSVSALSVVSESLASAEPSFVVPSESFIFSASSAAPQPSSSTYSVSFTAQFETPSSVGPSLVTSVESNTELISSAIQSSDIQTEFTSTWTTTNSDGSVVTESGIISQSGTSLTTLTTFQPATSLVVPPYSVIETEFTSTWTATNSDSSVATESGVVSQSGTLLTTVTTFPPASSAIVPEFTSPWETDTSIESSETLTVSASSYETVGESLAAATSSSFSSATVVVAPSESEINASSSILNNEEIASASAPVSDTTSIAEHHDGSLSMTTTEFVNSNSLPSSHLIVTATITSCNKSKCSESVVTYVSSVSCATITVGDSEKNISTVGNNVSSIVGDDVSNTQAITMATSTEGATTLTSVSGAKPSVANDATNSVHTTDYTTVTPGVQNGSSLSIPSDVPIEISVITPTNSSSSAVTIPYKNGSNKELIENIKYLALVVFGLMMFM